MLFTIPRLQALLTTSDDSPNRRAKLDNLACEERVGAERLHSYQDFLKDEMSDDSPFCGAPSSWSALHDRYFRQRVAIRDSATFLQASELTARATIPEVDRVVRVERIDGAFKNWEKGLTSGKSAVQWLTEWAETLNSVTAPKTPSPKRVGTLADIGSLMGRPAMPDPPRTVSKLFDYWNTPVRKQQRPSFVAFEAELKDELDALDWPQRLCVCLGLGHHFLGKDVTLALLRYRVSHALDAWKGTSCFCAPTVLDSGFGEYFHPSPCGCDWGFATVLDGAARDNALVAELLHRRIDYRPEHLWRVGTVNRAAVIDSELVSVRNAHLGRLRRQSGRDDFGIMR